MKQENEIILGSVIISDAKLLLEGIITGDVQRESSFYWQNQAELYPVIVHTGSNNFVCRLPVQPILQLRCIRKTGAAKPVMLKLRIGEMFPLAASLKHAYYFTQGFVLKLVNNCLLLRQTAQVLPAELRLLLELAASCKVSAWKAIFLRSVYHLRRLFKPRTFWLISDRPDRADDNGEAFFTYAVQKVQDRDVYFLLRKDSVDYPRLSRIGKVIPYGSLRHKFYQLLADVLITSGGSLEFMLAAFNKEYYKDILFRQKRVFLQHGITQCDYSAWLNKYEKNFSLLITASPQEQAAILRENYFYDESVVQLIGFARYDFLQDKPGKIICIMPSWRDNLINLQLYNRNGRCEPAAGFKESAFFKFYNSLLNDARLLAAVRKYGYQLKFVLHPNMRSFSNAFTKNASVKFVTGQECYRDLINESCMVVTDYSSVAFDFAYLHKPVLYCQFDREEYTHWRFYHQGYFDYETAGLGEVVTTLDAAVDSLLEYLANGCTMKPCYRERVAKTFAYRDRQNCQRIYEAVAKL
jgi:CDP-glycerol glycerophosphotransferase (TagB/SpsB family)